MRAASTGRRKIMAKARPKAKPKGRSQPRAAAKGRPAKRAVKKVTARKAKKVPFLGKGYNAVNVSLCVKDAIKALDWYKNALGAKVGMIMPGPGGKGVMHAEFTVGGTKLMIADEMPGFPNKSPESTGSPTASLYCYVPDCDKAFDRAVKAGAQVLAPLMTMFWGDRMGGVKDPFGHFWTLATHVQDVSPAAMRRGHEAMMAEMAKPGGMGG
jgi:uncharacterized glyoxalase superfamily protein PhnB